MQKSAAPPLLGAPVQHGWPILPQLPQPPIAQLPPVAHIDCGAAHRFAEQQPLFRPRPRSGHLDQVMTELAMLLGGGRDGGLYMMIGKKRAA